METDEILTAVGELLAKGLSDDEIIAELEKEEDLSHEDACKVLRDVYDKWQHTREVLDLDENNLKDWHVHLRKHILKTSLADGSSIASLRLALSVLDSLAGIQGISTEQGQIVPLAITLVEKKEETETETETGDNNG